MALGVTQIQPNLLEFFPHEQTEVLFSFFSHYISHESQIKGSNQKQTMSSFMCWNVRLHREACVMKKIGDFSKANELLFSSVQLLTSGLLSVML